MKRGLPVILMLAWAGPLFGDCPQPPAAVVLPWVSSFREAAGLEAPSHDPVLEGVAREYAQALAARGVLAHRDDQGRNALERVQAGGGTSTLVGEILGSGVDPAEICSAWGASDSHRNVVLNPLWTHLGIGCASAGARQVWVVLFAAQRMAELSIETLWSTGPMRPGSLRGFRVSGRLPAGEALKPVLLSGFALQEPELWLPGSGRFEYLLPPGVAEVYHRLGYRDAQGTVTITDAFYPARAATSARERGPR